MSNETNAVPGSVTRVEAAEERTVVKGIADHVSNLIDKAADSMSRLGNLKYRLLEIQDDSKSTEETPEPVRQDIEELKYRLSKLDAWLDVINHHVSDLERL